ncbi:hypothetical protein SAMN05216452_3702 [Nitratireductor aquibiodomus]|uniref:Uncharacterized protein n=1 Tax=Nitratireductor aquibiodomus TaxID=204799 RepID=A0A1H4ND70_9HYPH|nr:hypothetical protein [Nitratireductor aquibiodomus]SEB92582.1 hypothetical protein SAMN05216452_3702 [Nitratireductor aquibiodomus]
MSITAFLLSAALLGAGPGDDGRWQAGQYSFSDELGGFRIQAVSGTGSRSDPVLLRQELYTASAVVLVIRTTGEVPRYAYDERAGAGYLFIEIETLNASNLPWVEFEFELQEMRGISSVYGDGLSFDQRNVGSAQIGSSAFATHDRKFEPYDRLLFQSGTVDAGHSVTFRLLITDLTPKPVFYLVQDPRIPAS